jgi:4-amino-4-deoxy-L-arabinose transferase-like glycosyltransferase
MVLLLLGGWGRWITRDEPLELDLTVYATIAHEMLGGRFLYADLWDHKPPAVHVTYAAAELLVGYGPGSVLLLNVTALWLTMIGCFLAGRTVGGAFSGLAAAATFLVLSFSLELQANQPNTEVFINACTVWAMWLVLRDLVKGRPLGWGAAVAVGLLVGLASLYKTIAVLPVAGVLLYWSIQSGLHRGTQQRWRVFAASSVAGCVTLLMWVAVGSYFYAVGRWDAFYACVFAYNKVYAGGGPGMLSVMLHPMYVAFWVASGLVLFLREPRTILAGHRTAVRYALLVLSLGCAVTAALPGYPYMHYAQLWFPAVAMLAAWLVAGAAPDTQSIAEADDATTAQTAQLAWDTRPILALVIALLPMTIYHTYLLATLSPEKWSEQKYGNLFVASKDLGKQLRSMLASDERYYHIGVLTGLYFYSGLSPASGVILYQPLKTYDFPYPPAPLSPPEIREPLLSRLMRDLEQSKPDVVTLSVNDVALLAQYPQLQSHPLMAWLLSNYQILPPPPSDTMPLIRVLVRKGSNIQRRMASTVSSSVPVPPSSQGQRP